LEGVLCRALLARGERTAALAGGEAEARRLFEEASSLAEGEAARVGGLLGSLARRRGALRHLLAAACRQGDAAAALEYQERERGRLLLEWTVAAGTAKQPPLCDRPDWRALADELAQCEQALCASARAERAALGRRLGELLARRDRLLERHLLEGDRPAALLPAPPSVVHVSASLPPGTVYAAPVLGADRFYLLGVHRGGAVVVGGGPAEPVRTTVAAFLAEVEAQTKHYEQGYALGLADRRRLDGLLEQLGRGPLGEALEELLQRHSAARVMWAADEGLHGLPVHAVRLGGSYLIERAEVCHTPGAALMVEHGRGRQRGTWRAAVAFAELPAVLPAAAREAEGVAAVFLRGRCVTGPDADRCQLRRWLRRARIVHLACHAEFEPHCPLAARLRLPSGESLHALEWLDEPVGGLALMTLSACRAGAAAPLAGGEAFGLATGLLAGRVRAVVAGLWKVADAEAPPLMWSFYRHLMRHPVATALALAQREGLSSANSSPLFWAAFALFGDPRAVPAPPAPWRWLAGWRQRRHRRRYQR
jgi:CHAT domain-containing protein